MRRRWLRFASRASLAAIPVAFGVALIIANGRQKLLPSGDPPLLLDMAGFAFFVAAFVYVAYLWMTGS